jgi:hypothetical protein
LVAGGTVLAFSRKYFTEGKNETQPIAYFRVYISGIVDE